MVTSWSSPLRALGRPPYIAWLTDNGRVGSQEWLEDPAVFMRRARQWNAELALAAVDARGQPFLSLRTRPGTAPASAGRLANRTAWTTRH